MTTFEELGVRDDLLRGIADMGFVSPMPVQEKVIPTLLEGDHDLVGLAQTGTGKTAAFGLPVIQRVDVSQHVTQSLVLAPTRELCLQIAGDMSDFAKYIPAINILPVYGGSSIGSQIKTLRKGVHIIVATPGRLIDLINRNVVKLDGVNTVVLDEADEMLNMGFVDSINDILSHVPAERKMLLFSATMPAEVAKIAIRFMNNPEEVVIGTRNEGAKNVEHVYYMVNARNKYLALKRIADDNPNIYAIVFCRTRLETQEIADKLIQDGYNADSLHGDLSQQQRDIVMKKFRDRVLRLLVATDVAARGLDVDDLTHVINYGLPEDTAVYTHRSGRTGRAGKTGISVSIVHSREKRKMRDIERIIGKKFEHKEVPTPKHIIEKQLYNLAAKLEHVEVNDNEINRYLPGVLRKLSWLSSEDLLKRVLSLEFNRLLAYYQDAPNIDYVEEKKPKEQKERNRRSEKSERSEQNLKPRNDKEKDRRTADKGLARIYVNMGKADGFFAGNLIDLINKNSTGPRIDVGRIDLLQSYSLFDVKKGDAHRVVSALKGIDFFGKRVYSEIADTERDYAGMSERKSKFKKPKKNERRFSK